MGEPILDRGFLFLMLGLVVFWAGLIGTYYAVAAVVMAVGRWLDRRRQRRDRDRR